MCSDKYVAISNRDSFRQQRSAYSPTFEGGGQRLPPAYSKKKKANFKELKGQVKSEKDHRIEHLPYWKGRPYDEQV